MAYIVNNGGISTLAATVSSSTQTTITVASGHGTRFPSPTGGDYTLITLENAAGTIEIVSIVGRSTDVMTVGIAGSAAANVAGRGMEGTTATTWAIADIVEGRATAAIVARGGNAKTAAELAAVGGAALIGNTAAGNLVATTVQAAIDELDTEKAPVAQVHYVGTTSIAANRTSAAQALTGITSIDGNAATVTVADAGGDTTTFPMLATAATGSLAPATDAGLSYDAATNTLTAANFAGTATTANALAATAAPKIPTITATVGSSAMTVDMAAQYLDFRNADITLGTVTTLNCDPTALVIPSGATLGTVSGTESTLVVVVVNDGGTPVLAVANTLGVSGSDNTFIIFDDSSVISSATIGTGSDSALTWYSTTGFTSKPFRVIGYITSTQATAGTWITAPSNIYGCNKQQSSDLRYNADVSFYPHYYSSQQTITSGGSLALTHGLGRHPSLIRCRIVCITGESAYTAGQILEVGHSHESGSASDSHGVAIVTSATTIDIRYGSNANTFLGLDLSSGTGVGLTNAYWQFQILAWR